MIVLDTHAWIWWQAADEKLSPAARELIDRASVVGIPAICCYEVARAVERSRLRLDRDSRSWIARALAHPRVSPISLSPEVAITAAKLGEPFPGDPADRIIYATASTENAALVSADRAIRRFDPQRVIW